MNLRNAKKDIEYVLSAFIEDCSVAAAIGTKDGDEKIVKLYEEAVELYNQMRDRVNAKVEGSKKAHFTAMRKELLEKTDAMYEKLSAAIKESK